MLTRQVIACMRETATTLTENIHVSPVISRLFVPWTICTLDHSYPIETSYHIVAQQANWYIVHIAISYDTQRPPYNGWAVGLRAACMVSFDGPLYVLTSALQCVKHTEWDTCPGGGGCVWCLTYRDSAPRRPAQYTTTFSLAALGNGMD